MRKEVIGLSVGGFVLILLMFVFEQQVGEALGLIGYDSNSVSYFPFVKNMYLQLASSNRLASIDVTHFHLLDVVLWLSIAVWGSWLAAGIIFLDRYDPMLGSGFSRLSERYRGRRLYLYFCWIFMLSGPVVMSIPPRLDNPEVRYVLTHIPKFYFFLVALTYYFCGGLLLSFSVLLLIWFISKTFRQDRQSTTFLGTIKKTKEPRQ